MLNLLTVRLKFTRPVRCMAAATIGRHLLPAPELSSKPAGRCCRLTGQIDRQTDTRLFHDAYCILCGLHNQWTASMHHSFSPCRICFNQLQNPTFGNRVWATFLPPSKQRTYPVLSADELSTVAPCASCWRNASTAAFSCSVSAT